MKPLLIILIFLSITLTAIGQQVPIDSGFTNKAEAKNLMVRAKKEGKWCEYFTQYIDYVSVTTDTTNATSYELTIYKKGKPIGIKRSYNRIDGHLNSEAPYANGKINGIVKFYYPNGKLFVESPYINGKINGVSKGYHENGKLMSETIFKKGKEGKTKNYDENGNEIEQ